MRQHIRRAGRHAAQPPLFMKVVATVARPWDFRILASAATLILKLDKALAHIVHESHGTGFRPVAGEDRQDVGLTTSPADNPV